MISFFDAESPYTVYCKDCWWGDSWDPKDYGQDYDPSRPFMDQLKELFLKVPKAGALQVNNENSDYNALLYFSKDTYMSPGCYFVENCFYVRKSQYSRDCAASNGLNKCELVAESTNCDNCYNCHHLLNCRNCSASSYLSNCTSLENSFMCSGMSNKKYCFKNTQYTQEEYEKIRRDYDSKSITEIDREYHEFLLTIPQRALNQLNCENSTGDYLQNCKNALDCYDCFEVQDSRHLTECVKIKDSMDLSMHDKDVELCYELCTGGEKSYLTKFSYCAVASPFSEYTYSCLYLSHGFGCDGFHSRHEYIILNKQYSPEEYTKLRARIIEDMRAEASVREDRAEAENGNFEAAYGEFFPYSLSPFAYNESVAQDYFPITEELAKQYNIPWKTRPVPAIQSGPDVHTCIQCAKQFKIITQEKELYSKIGLPLSNKCPECRYLGVMSWKNPKQLYARTCTNCGTDMQSTYAPDRPEIVYCEACYLQTKA